MPVLELKTWPAGRAWSRGMGKPLCSLLDVECTLPLLRKLLQSSCSSRCLSTDRLSFSIQLSTEHTGSQTKPPQSEPGEGASQPGLSYRCRKANQVSCCYGIPVGCLKLEQTGIWVLTSIGHEKCHMKLTSIQIQNLPLILRGFCLQLSCHIQETPLSELTGWFGSLKMPGSGRNCSPQSAFPRWPGRQQASTNTQCKAEFRDSLLCFKSYHV